MRIGPMLAAALCLLAACARLPRQREARYMEQARQLVQKKDYTRAALLYRNAIQAMPGDAEPYYQLGLTYLAAGSHSQAIECFRKATEIDPKHAAAQLKLADLLARANDAATLSDAERRAQEIVTLFPDDVDALNTVALTELRLGRTEQAAAHLEQALNRLPGGLESSALLMRARLAQRDTQGAEEALQKCYRKAPQSAELALVMGRFYLVTQRPGPAEEQFRRAIRINPRYGAALLDLGITLFHLGRSDEAGRIFQQAAALPGKSYRPAYALFLLETGQRDAAIGELENLARQDPSDRAARTRLVKTYLAAGRRADADKALAAALAINPRDADALLQRGELSIDDGRYQDAQNDLNLVLRYRPETADPHIALARMYRGQGRTLNARQELAEALRLDSGRISVRLDLARLLIESKAARAALEVLGRAADSDKRTLAFIVESNWALLDLGRRDEARQGVAEGLRAARTPDLLLQDALLKIGDRNYTGARAALDAALAQNPEDVRALRALVKLYDARGQYAAGVAALREYVSRHGSSAPLQNYLGEVLLAGGQNGEARAAFAAAQSANPGFRPALLALVNLDVAGGRLEPAHRTLSGLLDSHPNDPELWLYMGWLANTEKDYPQALVWFRKVVGADPANVVALNNLAYLLASQTGQFDEALRYAQQVKELAPDNKAVDDTIGWIMYRKGMYRSAVKYLESAAQVGEDPAIRYHLGMAYFKMGDRRGEPILRAALRSAPGLPEAALAEKLLETRSAP